MIYNIGYKMENSTITSQIIQQSSESPQIQVKSNQELQIGTVSLYGVHIVSLIIERQERLCLAQISNTLLKQFSYNEIHNRRVALGITCVQCTPVQLEILRRAGAMPMSSRRCGMITRREAERLCKSFLGDNAPPRLPEDFAFLVHHECAWGCRGAFVPARYNSSRAKCIKCAICGLFFSPNKFIFHSHQIGTSNKYIEPDAANFNSWRRHMKLSGEPQDEIVHAWEDVKAMFNGGTRKRILSNPNNSNVPISELKPEKRRRLSPNIRVTSASVQDSIIGLPSMPEMMHQRVPSFSDLTLRLPGTRVIDYMWNKQQQATITGGVKTPAFSILSYLPWLTKRSSVLFPSSESSTLGNITSTETLTSFVSNTSYQSAFHPVQRSQPFIQATPILESDSMQQYISSKQDNTDDEIDVETMEDTITIPAIRSISNLSSNQRSHNGPNTPPQCWSPPRETEKVPEKAVNEIAVTTDIKTELAPSLYQQFNIMKDTRPLNCSDIDCLTCHSKGFFYGVARTSSTSFI